MEYGELTGYYTYRSFLNNPLPVDDFNEIKFAKKFAEAELFLIVQADNTITGTLSFPANAGASEKEFMNVTGTVKNWSSSVPLEFTYCFFIYLYPVVIICLSMLCNVISPLVVNSFECFLLRVTLTIVMIRSFYFFSVVSIFIIFR